MIAVCVCVHRVLLYSALGLTQLGVRFTALVWLCSIAMVTKIVLLQLHEKKSKSEAESARRQEAFRAGRTLGVSEGGREGETRQDETRRNISLHSPPLFSVSPLDCLHPLLAHAHTTITTPPPPHILTYPVTYYIHATLQLSGREMFEFNPDMVGEDDQDAEDVVYLREVEEEEEEQEVQRTLFGVSYTRVIFPLSLRRRKQRLWI